LRDTDAVFVYLQRFVYIKDINTKPEGSPEEGENAASHFNYNANAPQGDGKSKAELQAAEEEAAKAASAALKKEDDEFAKLESAFLVELGLGATDPSSPAKTTL
jgi:hypothetical protein